jgi:hypothetical protein
MEAFVPLRHLLYPSLVSPTVFREGPYRFFFFSREEPRQHVHVFSPEGEAKFWLEPSVEVAVSKGVPQASLKRMEGIILERKEEIVDAWNRHFSG